MRQLICFLLLGCFVSPVISAGSKPALMPYPASIEFQNGVFEVPEPLLISAQNLTDKHREVVSELISSLGIEHQFVDGEEAKLQISVDSKPINQYPSLAANEAYKLLINAKRISIQAPEAWGALHAVQTLRQLYQTESNSIPAVLVNDSPRFPWRGLLIDSVRHFISIEAIKRQLDGMASAKLNVLHWHLTDDQGWRIPIEGYPRLHQQASDGLFYTHEQIRDVVEYAAGLGIRVLPEVDFPGHASAIAVAYPELMSLKRDYTMERHWGVFEPLLDPSNPEVYQFIDAVFKQLHGLFPDEYVHIGGDEVKPAQWLESQSVQAFMQSKGLRTPLELHTYFNHRLQTMLKAYDRKMMGWDEILHPELDKNVVVQSWRGLDSLKGIVEGGFRGLLSNGYYIDQPQYAAYHYRNDPMGTLEHEAPDIPAFEAVPEWSYYQLEMPRLKGAAVKINLWLPSKSPVFAVVGLNQRPTRWARSVTQSGTQLQVQIDSWMGPLTFSIDGAEPSDAKAMVGNSAYPLKLIERETKKPIVPVESKPVPGQILGGEATLWSELVDEHNIDRRTWPRLYAIAERFWSPDHIIEPDAMYSRLWEIDEFATETVGLKHKSQFEQGLLRFVNDSVEFTNLRTVTEMLEPAHYYTRHHIHYQRGKYHQLAPLNNLVDVLPVQSKAMNELDILLSDMVLPTEVDQAKAEVKNRLERYQSAVKALQKRPPAAIKTLLPKLEQSLTKGLNSLRGCERPGHKREVVLAPMLTGEQTEIVLAIELRVLQLESVCQ